MKKSIIAAGAASIAIAAMPLAGMVSAVDFTDTINLSITKTCAFTRQTTPHGATGSWSTSGQATDVMTAASATLGEENELGSSLYKVVCNNVDGYQVVVAASALTKAAAEGDTNTASFTYDKTGVSVSGTWRIASDGTGAAIGSDIVATENTGTANESFEVTYYATPANNQAAGSYSGTAQYTFSEL